MHIYLETISVAVFVFPVLALLITLPYMLSQYHRYGAILAVRVGIVYSFVFYLLAAFFLTLLPLPDPNTLTHNAPVYLNLFHEVTEWKEQTGIVLGDSSTYAVALKNSILWEMIFNVLLLFPFGVYLRYYYRRNFLEVLIFSFLLSLFFEVTQLTGIYHLYPYSYRTFDVDDLFFNTLGGVLGFLFTPLFSFALPSRERLDQKSYAHSGRITVMRRAAAFVVDALAITLLAVFFLVQMGASLTFPSLRQTFEKLSWVRPLIHSGTSGLTGAVAPGSLSQFFGKFAGSSLWAYLQMLLPAMCGILTLTESITGGLTLGNWLVRIRLRSKKGRWPNPLRLLLRNALLYLLILPAPFYFTLVFNSISANADNIPANAALLLGSAFLVLFFYQLGNAILCSFKDEADYRYDKIAGLHMMSLVKNGKRRRTDRQAENSRQNAQRKDTQRDKRSEDRPRKAHTSYDDTIDIVDDIKAYETGAYFDDDDGTAAISGFDNEEDWDPKAPEYGPFRREENSEGSGSSASDSWDHIGPGNDVPDDWDDDLDGPDDWDRGQADDRDLEDWDDEPIRSAAHSRSGKNTRRAAEKSAGVQPGDETRMLDAMSDEELEAELRRLEKQRRRRK